IQVERLRLPVCKEEQWIVETINEHDVVIICGETGSGKTTQIPQFLYEAGYAHNSGIIGITEPRRVAATCIAERVAHEMNLTSQLVSYQIRYEGTAGERTKIKFMTDGVLLKEVQYDFELTKYNAIIIDEAHERSTYSDILIGFLSRIVRLRRKRNNPLKLVIMSATLKVADFKMNTKLFHTPPPVVNIDARQFSVTIHFNRHTPKRDYIEEAFRKVCKIHRKLPDGGILVFVTSQSEVHLLCSKLKKTFPKPVSNFKKMSEVIQTEAVAPFSSSSRLENRMINKNEGLNLNSYENTDDDEVDERDSEDGDDVDESSSDEQVAIVSSTSFAKENPDGPMYVLPLYSLLPSDKQALVFKPVPAGFRLCVVATNVAETSITIPNIKYVVDTGKVKTKFYDAVTGVSTFKVTFISQASANQRSGRAGRTGPGHCYRLYSSAVFSDFEEFSEPEIARKPVEDLVLQLKDIGVDRVKNFPFPTPPSAQAIESAERLLYRLGALEVVPCSIATSKPKKIYRLTDLGRTLAQFPLNPRYSKMLSLSQQHQLMPYVVALVAALSVQEVFVNSLHHHKMEDENCSDEKKRLEMQQARLELVGKGEARLLGDNMLLLKVVCLMDASKRKEEWAKLSEKYGIRWKALLEISKMRKQLITLLNTLIPDLNLSNNSTLKFPSQVQAKLLRQIVLSGHVDHIANKKNDVRKVDPTHISSFKFKILSDFHVFIHPSSSLFKNKCEYVVYQYIEETSKLYMKGVTSVELEWLPLFAPTDTRFDPVKLDDPDNPPVFDEVDGHVMCHMSGKFGPQFWAVPRITSELPKSIDCLKWFSKFLLEGLVCSKLALFKTFLLTPPSIVVKPWAHLSSRISNLLQALRDKNVHNRKALLDEWKKDPKFLLKEYSAWLPDSQHAVVASIWPPTS
ncbi:hypothetical protein HELRODRAFT_74874, partial [Helobdella robusta]|uniref:RNA helicase n=1 Tax=Helobdella robusta TaxID=6412 RepID=T1G1W9_HELRO